MAYSKGHGLSKKTCVCNALTEMYLKCGRTDWGKQIFSVMTERDVISWSMIIGLRESWRAIRMFVAMEKE